MKKGFTLVELLAVITVLAIILIIAIPNIQHLINENKKNTFLINAKSIIKQIKYEDKNFLTTQLSELNLEGIAKDGYDADLSTAYISDEEIHLNLVGAGQYKGMYLCNVNLTTNKSEVQNTPCEELEKYIVTFDPNGGSVAISNKEVMYNGTYGTLPVPKREGYKFLGWSSIPSDYQEVEYIESTGTQYINTMVTPSNNLNTEMVYVDTSANGSNYVLGSRSGSYGSTIYYGLVGNAADKSIGAYYNSYEQQKFSTIRVANKKYHVVLKIEQDSNGYRMHSILEDLTINNTEELYSPYYPNGLVGNFPTIFVFAIKNGQIHTGMRLYSLIFKENNQIIKNFIPCLRKSDNKIGLYDLINNEFYTNSGTGEFNKGNDGTYYYVTKNVKVTQKKNHTLTAIWEEI